MSPDNAVLHLNFKPSHPVYWVNFFGTHYGTILPYRRPDHDILYRIKVTFHDHLQDR